MLDKFRRFMTKQRPPTKPWKFWLVVFLACAFFPLLRGCDLSHPQVPPALDSFIEWWENR